MAYADPEKQMRAILTRMESTLAHMEATHGWNEEEKRLWAEVWRLMEAMQGGPPEHGEGGAETREREE